MDETRQSGALHATASGLSATLSQPPAGCKACGP